MLIVVVGFAQKSVLWQQVTPIFHRYTRLLCSPCATSMLVFVGFAGCVGCIYEHERDLLLKCWIIHIHTCKSQPILMLFQVFGAVPNAQRASYAGWVVNVPNAQSRGGIDTLWYSFRLFCHPLCPKSKWHVQPPACDFAYGSYSQLCQSLCPSNGSKPSPQGTWWLKGLSPASPQGTSGLKGLSPASPQGTWGPKGLSPASPQGT